MNWKNIRRNIEETDQIAKRQELIEDAQALLSDSKKHLGRAIEGMREKVKQLMSTSVTGALFSPVGHWLSVLAIVLVAADVPVQAVLMRAGFPALPTILTWVTALALSVGVATVVHSVSFVATFDPARPRRQLRILLTMAAFLGAVATTALSVLLFSRTAPEETVSLLVKYVGICFWVFGETMPVAAGLISAAAQVVAYPRRQAHRLRKLEMQLTEIDRFEDWLMRERARLEDMNKESVADTPTPASPSTVIASILVGVLTLGCAHLGQAQISSASDRMVVCKVAEDETSSVNKDIEREAVSRFVATLTDFVTAFRCDVIRVGVFADGGAFSQTTEVEVPKPPPLRDCSKAEPQQVSGLDRAMRSVGSIAEHERNVAREKCQQRHSRELSEFNGRQKEFLEQVRNILRFHVEKGGECTALRQMIARDIQAGVQALVVITDGAETCSPGYRMKADPFGRTRVVFLLLPSVGPLRIRGEEALQRGNEWQRLFPNLVIVLPSEINAEGWPAIAAGQNVRVAQRQSQ